MASTRVSTFASDADRLNILKQDLDAQCREEDRAAVQQPVVHSMGEQLSAYSLHPGWSWPTPAVRHG